MQNAYVIMAARNSATELPHVLNAANEAAIALFDKQIALHLIAVACTSTDATASLLEQASEELLEQASKESLEQASKDSRVSLAVLRLNGYAAIDPNAVYAAGIQSIERSQPDDLIVTCVAHRSHDLRLLDSVFAAMKRDRSGVAVVTTKRTKLQRATKQLAARAVGRGPITDPNSTFRVFRREVLSSCISAVPDLQRRFLVGFVPVAQALGYHVSEIPLLAASVEANEHFGKRQPSIAETTSLLKESRQLRKTMRADQTAWAQRHPDFNGQSEENAFEFGNNQALAALADASSFNQWIAEALVDATHGDILEIGAGSGTMTKLFACQPTVRSVVSMEPSDSLFAQLNKTCEALANATAFHGTSNEFLAADPSRAKRFSSAVYVSVLEHIEDDAAELRVAASLLQPGATIGIFVPAMPSIYGSVDFLSGHFRRYSKEAMVAACDKADLSIVSARYFDPVSVFPYWLNYRVLKTKSVGEGSGALFDKVIVPLGRLSERILPKPPRGKNVIVIARVR